MSRKLRKNENKPKITHTIYGLYYITLIRKIDTKESIPVEQTLYIYTDIYLYILYIHNIHDYIKSKIINEKIN